ncbi:VOC family protein [Paenibacillus sp. SYP-B3998]|uniref:VOC family protein n=1 Tax=Paenibacillus sp. SYP-B3998 TaxID=2678564 RepID=A0A6G4A483_9BACL|nr:VOC family protein [Paenibacillus sp. SYP-B3998]NEW09192.1 VOC family protein [Paenibacillus sp. SYP-B3998]
MGAKLNPYIMSEDARTQAEFYKRALGGDTLSIMTFGQMPDTPEAVKDKVMHMVLTVAGANTLFLTDSFEPLNVSRDISLALTYDNEAEAREAYSNLSEGGAIKFPFDLQPWGAYYGEIMDKFGVTWQIVKQQDNK